MTAQAPYPPPPWRLQGQAWAAAWLVRDASPAAAPPAGWRPLRLGPWRLVGAVWAEYAPGGDLAYSELAVGLVVRRGPALAVTIPWIWVDSEASRIGGRRLWAIPKQPASFHAEDQALTAETPAGPAGLKARGDGLPLGRWPFGFALAQPSPAGPVLSRCRLEADVRLAGARWRLPPPLGGLPAKPVLAVRLTAALLVVGA